MTLKDIFVAYISSETAPKNSTPTSSIEKMPKIRIFWSCDQLGNLSFYSLSPCPPRPEFRFDDV